MTQRDQIYSDTAVGIGESLDSLYHSDAWPAAVERRFQGAREALSNLARELKELEARGNGSAGMCAECGATAEEAASGRHRPGCSRDAFFSPRLGRTSVPQFAYCGTFSDGRTERGIIAIRSAKLAVGDLMRRRMVHAEVFRVGDPTQVGGISQERKGGRRNAWWTEAEDDK